MASYNELNALIDAYINRNGVQAITGQILNGVLKAMVEQLGRGYTIMGAAIPTTDPGTPDGPECYFASETGTYTDFDGLQVVPGELALLCYTPSDGWTKATIYEGFREVGATIDGNVGTPSVGVSYADGVLSFDFHNMKGNPGQNGQDGAAAGFGTIGADIAGGVGTPAVSVESSGPATAKNLQFHFTNLKGETGVTSVVATVDNTTGTPACTVSLVGQQLTLAFTGLKGAQGDTGSSVDYPFTIVNNLTTDDATQALSAAQGVVLEGKVTQLEAKVTDLEEKTENSIVHTRNLADSAIRDDSNYVRSDGKIGAENGNLLIIFPCLPSTTYTISKIRTTRFRVACFDEYPDGGVQGYGVITDATATSLTITTGISSTYIAAWVYNATGESVTKDAVMASLQIELGSTPTEYITPGYTAVDLIARGTLQHYIPVDNLTTDDATKPLSAKQGFVLKGIVDTGFKEVEADASSEDHYININSGVVENNSYYHYFDYNVNGGDILLLSVPNGSSAVAVIAMYSGDNFVQEYSRGQYGGDFVVIVPATVTKVRISLLKTKTYSIRKSSLIHFNEEGGGDVSADLKLKRNGAYYTISSGEDSVVLGDATTSRNKNLCFSYVVKNGTQYDASDDITPLHILNTTLGGNHAQPVTQATITAHGFVNADIGAEFVHSNGYTYYLVKIVDVDNARFLSANEGTMSSPVFRTMPTGTLTRGGETKTISAASSSQMWPGIKNESFRIIVDGIQVENSVEEIYGNVIDFVESYDIMNPASVLANLISNAGNNENGVFNGDVAIHEDITYRFLRGLNRIVTTNYVVVQEEVRFGDMMFSQKTGSQTAKYYTPNCSAFAVPAVFSSAESVSISESNTIKDTGVPCNRVLQYYESANFAFATGIVVGVGVGKNLGNYTDESFELRGSTKKIYPTPVTSGMVGNSLHLGDMYTAVMYYAIAGNGQGNRLSMYHFNLDGVEYVFLDYKGDMLDKVSISDNLNGKEIEVLEASNTELVKMKGNSTPFEDNNIYNGGFYVKATYVNGETCYLVAKII